MMNEQSCCAGKDDRPSSPMTFSMKREILPRRRAVPGVQRFVGDGLGD